MISARDDRTRTSSPSVSLVEIDDRHRRFDDFHRVSAHELELLSLLAYQTAFSALSRNAVAHDAGSPLAAGDHAITAAFFWSQIRSETNLSFTIFLLFCQIGQLRACRVLSLYHDCGRDSF